MNTLSLPVPNAIGVDKGAASDGVLFGAITPAAMAAVVGGVHVAAAGVFAYTDDGGLYVNDSADFNDAGADDVQPLPATPAVDDAFYLGADETFSRVDLNVSTAGSGTWTVAYEYWDGSAFVALSSVTDPTTGFSAGGTGINSLTWDMPVDWAKNTVDGVLKYWMRVRVTAFTSVTTPALLAQGFVVQDELVDVDLTTEANEATADDVPVTSSYPTVGERLYFGGSSKFCKIKVVLGTSAVGTLTFTWKYWNGSTYAAIPVVNDATVDFSAAPGTYFVSFVPPADWVANTALNGPDGQAGFFVVAEVATASGSITVPLLTQVWTLPLTAAAADGILFPATQALFTIVIVNMSAQVASASGTDSHFILLNATTGNFVSFAWTAEAAVDAAAVSLQVSANNELLLIQVQEQGTTEFQDALFVLMR